MDSNFKYAGADTLIFAPASRPRRGLHRLRTKSSRDSPLEGNGFELPVRGSSEAGCCPFSCVSCLGRVGAPVGVLRFSSFFMSGKPFDGAWLCDIGRANPLAL